MTESARGSPVRVSGRSNLSVHSSTDPRRTVSRTARGPYIIIIRMRKPQLWVFPATRMLYKRNSTKVQNPRRKMQVALFKYSSGVKRVYIIL